MHKLLAVVAIALFGLIGCAHQQQQGGAVKTVYLSLIHISEPTRPY